MSTKITYLPKFMLAITLSIFLSGCASIINPGYIGVKNHPLGKGVDTTQIYKDGFLWKNPFVSVIKYNIQWQTFSEEMAILTNDELHTTINLSIVLRIKENELPHLILEVGNQYYPNIIKPVFFSVARNTFSKYNYMDLSGKGLQIQDEIMAELKSQIHGKHIEIDRVTIDHIVYSKVVTEATDLKLATKQKVEQKNYEILIAEKDAEIQRTLAKGQYEAQMIINEGLTSKYLQFKALEVQEKLENSPNAKFYFVPMGKDGIPIILDSGK